MVKTPQNDTPQAPDGGVKGILEWLALAHGQTTSEDTEELLRNTLSLREAAISTAQRIKLLDLLYAHTEGIVRQELLSLKDLSLPIPRKTRQRMKTLLELLETLTQDYFNTLAILFDPDHAIATYTPQTALRRAMLSIAWQIRLYHLISAPPRHGLWQQLHAAFKTAHRLDVDQQPSPRDTLSIRRLYTNALLIGIAQPASFSAGELEFINTIVEQSQCELTPNKNVLGPVASTFWIDPDRDFPAHALVRRTPGTEIDPLYFSCAQIAQHVTTIRQALTNGEPPAAFSLPDFANSSSGQGVLRRLEQLWGQPAKRKFPRRRQSHRIRLCSGLDTLHRLLSEGEGTEEFSEWMVTNESPDGFALMHMTGNTNPLKVGDLAAMQILDEKNQGNNPWLFCMLRWAISENPEHVEIGLQLLASKAIPAKIAHADNPEAGTSDALILPEAPPLRSTQSLVVAPGILKENARRIIVLVAQGNLSIHEVQTTQLEEQTGSLEIFSALPEGEEE